MLNKRARSSIFLFGSFSFAWVLFVTIHELGHAIAMWTTGGIVEKITINPFSWSYTYYGSSPKYPIFTSAAGAGFGILIGTLLVFLTYRKLNLYLMPIWLIGAVSFLHSGAYYIFDILFDVGGDASRLLSLGVSNSFLLGLSILALISGSVLFLRLVPMFGLTPKDNFLMRFFVLGFGIIPYFLLAVFYALIFNPNDIFLRSSSFFATVFFILIVSGISMRYPNLTDSQRETNISNFHISYAMILGILALTMPYLLGIYR